ncbi:MAG TPA: DUF4136 domain-containing protein [Candidatus Angelobacter sp.]|nr:DUF4136 domain-containing protein [Candidatus Angelobacter sp.]
MRIRAILGRAVGSTLLVIVAISAWAQKIETGHDKAADFSRYKTYAVVPRDAPAMNPMIGTLIDGTVENQLNQKGLHKVDSDPDLLVKTYGGPSDMQSSYAASDPNYTGSGGIPLTGTDMWTGSASPMPLPPVVKGQLTVDLIDARQKHLVWRATAKGKMDPDDRKKLLDQANKAVEKMFKEYPPSSK